MCLKKKRDYLKSVLFAGLLALFVPIVGCKALFNRPPVAVIRASPTTGEAPLTVNFDGSGSYDPDGTVVSYEWNFGDGSFGTGASVSHTFNNPGAYTVVLIITDNKGATGTDTVTINASQPATILTLLTIDLSPSTLPEDNVTHVVVKISGRLTRRDTGQGIGGKVISLSFQAATWTASVSTDSNGYYQYEFTVSQALGPSSYEFRAEFAGDDEYGASSASAMLTVTKSSGEKWSCAPRVFILIFNPILEADGGVSLVQYYSWNDPDALAEQYIADIEECSYGQVRYKIAARVELDEWPLFEDGFRYTDETYKQAWETRTMHEGTLDYVHYLDRFDIKNRVNSGEIDEVWIFGFPWGWTWESCMAGPDAIWINGPIISYSTSRPFPIMGFNYEREVDCMLENLGHRAECTLNYVYNGGWWWDQEATHLWGLFTRTDKTHPGEAGCGTVHFAPNSESDYDWGNSRYVWSTCDDWLYNFPYLTGYKKLVNCEEWGNGDMRLHHKWWFKHFPHHEGRVDGKLINWWKYVIQWDKYKEIGP